MYGCHMAQKDHCHSFFYQRTKRGFLKGLVKNNVRLI